MLRTIVPGLAVAAAFAVTAGGKAPAALDSAVAAAAANVFEGLVSADSIGQIKQRQVVRFRINGYASQEFLGRVKRIDPAAQPY